MRFVPPRKQLERQARRGFRGYPLATVAFYGPDSTRASKVAVAIVPEDGAEPARLERWFSQTGDVRTDSLIGREILTLLNSQHVKSVVLSPGVIGCPHEEGVDYAEGAECPRCPYWHNRDRWTDRPLDDRVK